MKLNFKKILIREIARQNVLPRTSLTAFWNSVLLPMIARVSSTSTKINILTRFKNFVKLHH